MAGVNAARPKLSRWQSIASSRLGRGVHTAYVWRRPLLLGLGAGVAMSRYYLWRAKVRERDTVRGDTLLVWRMYDGSIVEYPGTPSSLAALSAEAARVMTVFDAVKTLQYAAADPSITGIFADFSHFDAPTPATGSAPLGLAQIEELHSAMSDLKAAKGPGFRSVAFSESFASQGEYLLATAFDEVYLQPTGEVPLVGLSSTLTFWTRLISWLGIKVHAEARGEYKSVVSPYTQEQLTEPQTENQIELMNALNNNFLSLIAAKRLCRQNSPKPADSTSLSEDGTACLGSSTLITLTNLPPDPKQLQEAVEKVRGLTMRGPLTAKEALESGLIDGTAYRGELLEGLLGFQPPSEQVQGEAKLGSTSTFSRTGFTSLKKLEVPLLIEESKSENMVGSEVLIAQVTEVDLESRAEKLKEAIKKQTKGFYHYWKLKSRELEKADENNVVNVGVVYVLGAIGDVGDFGTAAIVKGLKEAADDDEIGAVVLRIDSGGGGVIESDTIWGAVRDLRAKGKIVVASFGNIAASGGYLIATHADAIFAAPSTITGSIGVAAMRPTFTEAFFDKFKINVQSFFTGTKSTSLTHELEGEDLQRYREHTDSIYENFKNIVSDGRGISSDLMESIAGGRVYTGLQAWELMYPSDQVIEDNKEIKQAIENATQLARDSLVEVEGTDEQKVAVEQEQVNNGSATRVSETSDVSQNLPAEPEQVAHSSPASEAESTEETATTLTKSSEASQSSPWGKGVIDGLGGIHDAAVYALEMYLGSVMDQEMRKDPTRSKADILADMIPGVSFAMTVDEDKVLLPLEVRLKKFPVPKTFWQQIREASERGDAAEEEGSWIAVKSTIQLALTSFLVKLASSVMNEEMKSLGLEQLRVEMKRVNAEVEARVNGRSRVRVEMPLLSVR